MKRKIKSNIILTPEEYNVLNNITSQTKTDCWFWLDKDKNGLDCVKDLERRYKVTLRFAIRQLNEAISDVVDLIKLTDKEIETYVRLLEKLNIPENPFEKHMDVMINVYGGNGNGISTEVEEGL